MIRSRQLFFGTVETVNEVLDLYTVPVGARAIVRELLWGAGTASPSTVVDVFIGVNSGGTYLNLVNEEAKVQTLYEWRGDLVLNEGDSVHVLTAVVPLWIVISGAELEVGTA